jgi:hypothetical protein
VLPENSYLSIDVGLLIDYHFFSTIVTAVYYSVPILCSESLSWKPDRFQNPWRVFLCTMDLLQWRVLPFLWLLCSNRSGRSSYLYSSLTEEAESKQRDRDMERVSPISSQQGGYASLDIIRGYNSAIQQLRIDLLLPLANRFVRL